MKVLFIQDSLIPQIGVMSISASLKSKNHQTKLVQTKNAIKTIKEYKPGLIVSSVTTGEHKNILKILKEIKQRFNIPVLLGGPHPTFFPDIINNPYIDFICVGEGDHAILDLVSTLEKNKAVSKIPNIWTKENKNPIRNLVENLDSLSFPDREIYYQDYEFLRNFNLKNFNSGRGCPFNCTFCFNHAMKKLYKNKGRYVRKRSPENIIKEIQELKNKYHLKYITFADDTFIVDHKWLKEFSRSYKEKINIPFICNIRANLVTKEVIKDLKYAGCFAVSMGIESGNEYIRNNILKKDITNEQILKTGELIKKYNLKLKTYNMLGYPEETLDNAFETIYLNANLKPDQASFAIIQPYPGTEFCQQVKEQGYLDKNFNIDKVPVTLRDSSPIKYKNKKQIENLLAFAFISIKFPFLIPLVKILIKLPPNPLYKLISKAVYGYYMSRFYNMGLIETIKYALKSKYRFA